jgi:hypothetical protein
MKMSMVWKAKHPQADPEMMGYIPMFLNDEDPRSAREQLDLAYGHGGGWRPFKGFTMLSNGNMQYPGDPPTQLLFESKMRNEIIRFYDCSWVAIIQPDGSFEVCRMD